MKESINSYVRKYLADISEESWNELDDLTVIREIIDSLDWADFIFAVNHEFYIALKPDELKRDITIGELNDLIAEKVTDRLCTSY